MLKKSIKVKQLLEDLGGEENIDKKFFKPCTLTDGIACAVLILKQPYKKQSVLFCTRDWSKKETKYEDDSDFVENFNKEMMESFAIEEDDAMDEDTLQFEAVVGSQFEMTKVFAKKKFLLAPDAKFVLNTKHVKAVFLERMSSYTRTFDFNIVNEKEVMEEFSAIHRKDSHKTILSIFQDVPIYSTGPDPLEWTQLLQMKQENKLDWAGVYEMLTRRVENSDSEEEESEWEAGNTEDEEDEESDYEDEDEDYEEENSEELSDSSDDGPETDYDRYERLSRPTKKFKKE